MTKPAKATASEAITPFQPMATFNGAIWERLIRNGAACAEACLAWQQELFRFASSRLQRNVEASQALASCTNVTDAIEVQKVWMDAAVKDSVATGRRLMEITTIMAPACLGPSTSAPIGSTEGRAAAE